MAIVITTIVLDVNSLSWPTKLTIQNSNIKDMSYAINNSIEWALT